MIKNQTIDLHSWDTRIKALLVDDHELLLNSLEIIHKEIDENLKVLKAKTCKAASEITSNERDLSLVLLELNLPDASGINHLLEFTAKHPLLPVIIFSSSEDGLYPPGLFRLYLSADRFCKKTLNFDGCSGLCNN